MSTDHNDVLKQSHIERSDVIDAVGEDAKKVSAKEIRAGASDGESLIDLVVRARVAIAASHARTYDRVTLKQVKAEGAALKKADPTTIKALRQVDIDEERNKR